MSAQASKYNPAEDNARTGRPSLITDEVIDRVSQFIRAGNAIEVACTLGGISKPTMIQWMKRGSRVRDRIVNEVGGIEYLSPDDKLYLRFVTALEKAFAECEASLLVVILNAARGRFEKDGKMTTAPNWLAAAWYLERTRPKRYARRYNFEDEQEGMTPEEVADKMQALYFDAQKAELPDIPFEVVQPHAIEENESEES